MRHRTSFCAIPTKESHDAPYSCFWKKQGDSDIEEGRTSSQKWKDFIAAPSHRKVAGMFLTAMKSIDPKIVITAS